MNKHLDDSSSSICKIRIPKIVNVSKYQSDSDDPNQTKRFAHFSNLRGETRVEYLATYLKQSFFFLKMY